MPTTGRGIVKICQVEALVTVAYEDGTYRTGPLRGQPKYSYGYGTQTTITGERVKLGDTITPLSAAILIRAKIRRNDEDLDRNLHVQLLPHVYDAFSSLYYQSGSRVLLPISEAFNTKTTKLAVLEFANWPTNEAGVEKEGLAGRRLSEMHLANTGDYGDLRQLMAFDGNPKLVKPYYIDVPAELLQ